MFRISALAAPRRRSRQGVTSLETALLLPIIFIFLLYAIQIGFILLTHQVTQYAAFMSARSYLVYGEKTLGELNYKYTSNQVGSGSGAGVFTNDNQSIAEATAEKIIFESLPWEHERIYVADEDDWYMKRVYEDGNDSSGSVNNGAVRVEFTTDPALHNYKGVKVTYCMPVLFPGIATFFSGNYASTSGQQNPCSGLRSNPNNTTLSGTVESIPVEHAFFLGREP